MPIICEDIKNKSIIKAAEYGKTLKFIHVHRIPKLDLPILGGENWKFQPCFLPMKYQEYAEEIANFPVYKNDIWLITFPKCGTTWTQAMVWLLNNNLNYNGLGADDGKNIFDVFPFLEKSAIVFKTPDNLETTMDEIKKITKEQRHIKSHLPVQLLPTQLWTVKPKIIYVVRNPKDVAISYYYHYRNIMGYEKDLSAFIELFLNDNVIYSPFQNHFIEFWQMREEKNILFLNYEDMIADHLSVIERVAKFLNKTYSKSQLMELQQYLTIESMRNVQTGLNPDDLIFRSIAFGGLDKKDSDFQFLRKGKAGEFINHMTSEQTRKFDSWNAEHLKDIDFQFSM